MFINCFGGKLSVNCYVYPSVSIWDPSNLIMAEGSCLGPSVYVYNVAQISIGQNSVISHRTTICAATRSIQDLEQLVVGEISIGKEAWIAMESFIGPGVRLGNQSVVYARSVVVREVGERQVVAGNPAKIVRGY